MVAVPVVSIAWGTIDDLFYKLKEKDGNAWAHLLGKSQPVKGDERPGAIAFTFDDGPDHRTTPVLLDQLDRYRVKAAFFINGARFHYRTAGGPLNQIVLREIYRRGHFVGNHTYSHKEIKSLDEEGWRTEVLQVEQVMRGLTGKRPWLFRPPFGSIGEKEQARLKSEGYSVVMWNLDPLDWKAKSAVELLRRAKKLINDNPSGGIFLLHDTNRLTIQAFPLIMEWLEERNAKLRAVGDRTLEIAGIEQFLRSDLKQ